MDYDKTPDSAAGWWRWPLVPVASIVTATIGALMLTTLQEVAIGFHDGYAKSGWFHLYIYPLIPSALAGYLLAGTAIRVAPAARVTAGVAMTAIMGFVLIAFTAFLWSAGVPRGDAIQTTVASAAAIAAAVVALLQSGEAAVHGPVTEKPW